VIRFTDLVEVEFKKRRAEWGRGRMNGEPMTNETKHISVCICTYKRPQFLKRLLEEFGRQDTNGLFTYSIVVADNDHLQSAKAVVADFTAATSIPIRYCVEPRQNIALAQNKAIENAKGDFVAFIDDDEFPTSGWLLTLFKVCNEYGVDGVLGPVKPHFDEEPPKWLVKGKFYERPAYPTGFVIDWRKGRTGNVLLKGRIFAAGKQPFRPDFLTGEDQDFFRRMIEKGHVFVWCNEAAVYEVIPPIRWKRWRFLVAGQTAAADVWKTQFAKGVFERLPDVILTRMDNLLYRHIG
jgi:succinoglycan biosynthesis protein ExoM